jgi:hypothetical protein
MTRRKGEVTSAKSFSKKSAAPDRWRSDRARLWPAYCCGSPAEDRAVFSTRKANVAFSTRKAKVS